MRQTCLTDAKSTADAKRAADARSAVGAARGARLFKEIDKNGDGRIHRVEFTTWTKRNATEFAALAGKRTAEQVFDAVDKSKKGYITLSDTGCTAASAPKPKTR